MTAFLVLASIQFYLNRIKDFMRSKWQWIGTAAVAVGMLAYLHIRLSRVDPTPPPSTATNARRELKVLEAGLAQTRAKYAALDKRDAELSLAEGRLQADVTRQKLLIVELEAGAFIDWDALSDAEIDAKFKAAGL